MLVNGDVKGLEWVGAVFLSQDEVGIEEIWNKVDQHSDNQVRFHLPSRLIAKTFVFRLIYGGSAYAYSVDPDFADVGYSTKKWQAVIDEFYAKYVGIAAWHKKLMHEATTTGQVVIPTGRSFPIKRFRNKSGEWEWPRPTILNYPVQGLGADLMVIARCSFYRRFKEQNIEGMIISSVHDSIVADVPDHEVERTARLMKQCIEDVPTNFTRLLGIDFNLPMTGEIQYGKNLKEVVDFNFNS